MLKYFLTLFVLLQTIGSYAQFGLRILASQNNYSEWNTIVSSAANPANNDLFNTSYELGLDYWFRLNNIRLEFYPEIGLGYSKSDNSPSTIEAFPVSYRLKKAYGGINTHFYFLDLKNDCKCPTFSKQNDFFKKGLFLILSSKVHFQNKETIYQAQVVSDNDVTLELGGGLGLDIGLSDLITLSPFGMISYFPSSNWDGISSNHGIIHILPPDETTTNLAFKIGLRIGFRPDYLKSR